MRRSRLDAFDHITAEEAERDAAELREYESLEAEEARWQEAFDAYPKQHIDYSAEWVDDREHAFKDDLHEKRDPGYSPGAPA
jgi:hypothetical protein